MGNNAGSIPIDSVVKFVYVDCNAIFVIKPSYRLLVFSYSFHHSSTCFTHVDLITISARDVVDYTIFLFVGYPILQFYKCLSNGPDQFKDGLDLHLTKADGPAQLVNPLRDTLDIRKAQGTLFRQIGRICLIGLYLRLDGFLLQDWVDNLSGEAICLKGVT